MEDSGGRPLFAAAIHIGDNYSSNAGSFTHEFQMDPHKVLLAKWNNDNFVSNSTPTSVLFTKEKKFSAFGSEAKNKYKTFVDNGNQGDFYFFQNFMMKIFNQTMLTSEFMLEDEMGKTMSVSEVFSACIKYLCERLIECMGEHPSFTLDISSLYIRWILTVPAAPSEPYKQFTRRAALMAGMRDEQIVIVSEPAAASLCCHYQLLQDSVKANNFVLYAPKTKHLVLDASGDCVDITIHEIHEINSIKQIATTRYEDCGGNYVNRGFLGLLADMFGNDEMDKFKTAHMEDYSSLLLEIEVRKRQIKNGMSGNFRFWVPSYLQKKFQQMMDIETNLQYKGRVSLIADKLQMDADLAKKMYTDVCEIIISHLKNAFKKYLFKEVSTILMVGGFSESQILQSVIKETFPDKRIVIPDEPGFAVLKGAVMFGHNPTFINLNFAPGYVPTRFSEK